MPRGAARGLARCAVRIVFPNGAAAEDAAPWMEGGEMLKDAGRGTAMSRSFKRSLRDRNDQRAYLFAEVEIVVSRTPVLITLSTKFSIASAMAFFAASASASAPTPQEPSWLSNL